MSRPAVRDQAAAVDRVLARLAQRDELVVALEVGESSAAVQRTVSSAISRARSSGSAQRPQLALRRHAVEAADAHVDRVDLAAADHARSARCRPS